MEKEETLKEENKTSKTTLDDSDAEKKVEEGENGLKEDTESNEISNEEKAKELEDKLARTFAEMENQRRRFEKEKNDAFDYGGCICKRSIKFN